MTRPSARTLTLFFAALILVCVATQGVSAGAPQAVPAQAPPPGPTNIKALPKNISMGEVNKLMFQYQGDLGVTCEFCHVSPDPATKRTDYASDGNQIKEVARYMIGMTADLNDKYLAEMPDRMYADPITCGTCHRGAKHPSVFSPAK